MHKIPHNILLSLKINPKTNKEVKHHYLLYEKVNIRIYIDKITDRDHVKLLERSKFEGKSYFIDCYHWNQTHSTDI